MLVKSDCEYGHFLQNLSLQSRYYVSVMADDESLGQSVVVVLVQTMPAKSNVHSLNNIELRRIRPERAVDSQCCFHWAFLSVLTLAMYLFCKRQVLQCRPVQECDTQLFQLFEITKYNQTILVSMSSVLVFQATELDPVFTKFIHVYCNELSAHFQKSICCIQVLLRNIEYSFHLIFK